MIKIEVWSDINCPFCYIGKRNLEKALESISEEVQLTWKSFELDPAGKPSKEADNTDLLAQKYGRDRKWAEEMNQNMTSMAAKVGLKFQLDKVIPANSFQAHRLLHLAKELGLQNEMKECLLRAKFVEGKDIEDKLVLKNCALGVGMGENQINGLLASDKYSQDVRLDEKEAAQLGVSGVPFFVINRQYALSGAQPVDEFLEVFSKIRS